MLSTKTQELMAESWTSNPYNKFQCLQMYIPPGEFTLLRLVNIMHPFMTGVALAATRFQSPTSLFQVGEQFCVWILHYRLTKCIFTIFILHVVRSEVFWPTLLHTLMSCGYNHIYTTPCIFKKKSPASPIPFCFSESPFL